MTDVHEMRVKKRNGLLEEVSFDKILNRVKKLGAEAKVTINFSALVMKIIDQLYDEIPTSKIDELTAEQCAYMTNATSRLWNFSCTYCNIKQSKKHYY